MLFNPVIINFPISTFFKILPIMQSVHWKEEKGGAKTAIHIPTTRIKVNEEYLRKNPRRSIASTIPVRLES